jgi:hypothetical protein
MSPPLYETPEDRARERIVADAVAASLGCTATRFPDKFFCDYHLDRDRDLYGFLEVKCRTTPFGHYEDGFMLDLTKWHDLRAAAHFWRMPSIVGVGFVDQIAALNVCRAQIDHVNINGRTDRSDPNDSDPVCYLAWSQFRTIKVFA